MHSIERSNELRYKKIIVYRSAAERVGGSIDAVEDDDK